MKTSKTLRRACGHLRSTVLFETVALQLPGTPFFQDATPAIREATRLYMQSWVLPIIDAIEAGDTKLLARLIR